MPRASAEEWAKRVERWKDSGLTAKEFAAETGINASTLTVWRWKLRAAARVGETQPEREAAVASRSDHGKSKRRPRRLKAASALPLLEVPLATFTGSAAVLELVVRDEVRLRIPEGVDEATLTRVVRALGVAR